MSASLKSLMKHSTAGASLVVLSLAISLGGCDDAADVDDGVAPPSAPVVPADEGEVD